MNEREIVVWGGCQFFREALGERVPECCRTCHVDHEEYGYTLDEVEVEHDGVIYYFQVCCAVRGGPSKRAGEMGWSRDDLLAVVERYLSWEQEE